MEAHSPKEKKNEPTTSDVGKSQIIAITSSGFYSASRDHGLGVSNGLGEEEKR